MHTLLNFLLKSKGTGKKKTHLILISMQLPLGCLFINCNMYWYWCVKREALPKEQTKCKMVLYMSTAEIVSICMILLSGLTLILSIRSEGML